MRYDTTTGEYHADDNAPRETAGTQQNSFDNADFAQQASQYAAVVAKAEARHATEQSPQSAAALERARDFATYHLSRMPERFAKRGPT